jgi:hypothetical protein
VWTCHEYSSQPFAPLVLSQMTHAHVHRLAYCELHITLRTFFRWFRDLKVFATMPDDVDYDDFLSSFHVAGKKWLKHIRHWTWLVETPTYHKLIGMVWLAERIDNGSGFLTR